MKLQVFQYELKFRKPAVTSRNVFETRTAYFIKLSEGNKYGWGEAGPLSLLSIDDLPDFDIQLKQFSEQWFLRRESFNFSEWQHLPSAVFALESAIAQLNQDHSIFTNSFSNGIPITINGLVWMDSVENMYQSALQKFQMGFRCLKFKIGAQDFDAECRMLEKIRRDLNAFKLEIRLDANGAFENGDALEKIKDLSRFEIHSIEQPIKAGQLDSMAKICRDAKIRIALDEELIGVNSKNMASLLRIINPNFIILKPTLIGGFSMSDLWIAAAKKMNIGWLATSALESNIGLNAIAQWVSQYNPDMPQGLGTGSLYENNIPSPLIQENSELKYGKNAWNYRWIEEHGKLLFELN